MDNSVAIGIVTAFAATIGALCGGLFTYLGGVQGAKKNGEYAIRQYERFQNAALQENRIKLLYTIRHATENIDKAALKNNRGYFLTSIGCSEWFDCVCRCKLDPADMLYIISWFKELEFDIECFSRFTAWDKNTFINHKNKYIDDNKMYGVLQRLEAVIK